MNNSLGFSFNLKFRKTKMFTYIEEEEEEENCINKFLVAWNFVYLQVGECKSKQAHKNN